MKRDKPDIDYKKHISYSKTAERALKARLNAKYGADRGVELWSETKHQYEAFLSDLPSIGGGKNPMADQLYDSIACFAYWEALPEKESVEDFAETVNETFFGFHAPTFPRFLSGKPNEGLRAVLVGCPICDFAKAHGYMHLMPAMCNGDYGSTRFLGVEIIRPKTVSLGHGVCDALYVGTESELLTKYPVKTDENGYMYNDEPEDL